MRRLLFRQFVITLFILASAAVCLISRRVYAQSDNSQSAASSNSQNQSGGSQTQSDSSGSGGNGLNNAYDPFIDYNEYNTSGQEEADINFFENGRLLSAQIEIGDRTFTDGFHKLYSDGMTYGGAFTYFFDLNIGLQFSFTTSSHNISISGGGVSKTGNVTFNEFGLDLKYYFNMADVTKGLASFNPYILIGFSPVTRISTVDGESEFSRDSAVAFDGGLGFEVPFNRHQMFLGAQAEYQVVNFPDQNTQITLNSGTINTGIYPNGGIITLLGFIGMSF